MATFAIVDSKGNTVGSLETDLVVKLSNPVAGKPNSGGKRFVSATVVLGDYGTGTSLWQKGASVAKSANATDGTLKL